MPKQRRTKAAKKKLSAMSCDNELPTLKEIHPAIMMIDIHAHEVGCRMVRQKAWRMSHLKPSHVETGIEAMLVERASVANW